MTPSPILLGTSRQSALSIKGGAIRARALRVLDECIYNVTLMPASRGKIGEGLFVSICALFL